MICPVCGAKCVCKKASLMCCSCHRHKARGPITTLVQEIAHAATLVQNPALPLFELRSDDDER